MNAETKPFRKDVNKLAIFEDNTHDSDDDSYDRKRSIMTRKLKKSILSPKSSKSKMLSPKTELDGDDAEEF
jgi:hypothetical protein